ncbi:creatininase, partial [mine drainage metagenome]
SFGIMKSIGYNPYPFFFNESGAHWLPAKTSYDYYRKQENNVLKVWSNTDRFYKKVLRNMEILDKKAIEKKADTYPIQLFIFPVYLISALPFIKKYEISDVLMGNEFDDPLAMESYNGITHYYGVFDQTWEFAEFFTEFMQGKGFHSSLWSIVYPVFGSMIENMLIKKFPDLYALQRSCHSCRSVKGKIIPCGKCTKCLGVRMFIENAGGDPSKILYKNDNKSLINEVEQSRIRLDPDEVKYLKAFIQNSKRENNHVGGVHLMPGEKEHFSRTPEPYMKEFQNFFKDWSNGLWEMHGNQWVKLEG